MRTRLRMAWAGLAVWSAAGLASAAPHAWDAPAFSASGKALVEEAKALPPLVYEDPPPLPSMTLVPLPGAKEATPAKARPADVEMLLDEHEIVFEASGTAVETEHQVLYLRGAAEDWGVLRVPWEPWSEDRPEVRARVLSPDGTEHVFDVRSISDVAESEDDDEVLGDRRVLRCALPAVEKGSVIEKRVVFRRRGLFAGVAPSVVVDLPWMPTRRFHVSVTGAPGRELAHRETGLFSGIAVSTAGQVTTLSLELSDPPRRSWRFEQPLPRDLFPRAGLVVAPKQSWQQVAASYTKIVDAQIAAGDVKKTAAEWAGEAKEPKAVVARFLAGLRRVRYTGLELGSAAVVPRPPSETLTRGFGDCKDLATLLVALLRSRGIAAEVALLRPEGADVDPAVPRAEGFSHAIVHVDAPNELWLDPTQADLRVGEPLGSDEGSLALPATAGTKELVKVPESPLGAEREVRTRELVLADDGAARMTETRDVWGGAAANYRASARNDGENQREWYERWVQETAFAKALGKFVPTAVDGDGPAHLELEMLDSRRGWTATAKATAFIDPAPLFIHVPQALLHPPVGSPARPEHQPMKGLRTQDLAVEPGAMELRYRVVPPAGYVLKTLPPVLGADLPFTASRTASVDDKGVVTVVLKLDLKTRRLDPAAVERVRKALDPLRDGVMLEFENKAEKLFAAKDVRAALDLVRADVAARPTAAGPLLRLSSLLLRAGFGNAARTAARRAVALEPKSLVAHRALADTLLNDSLGRAWTGDWDRTQAIAEYRAALAIDPKDFAARAWLAEALMRDAEGGFLSPRASLPEALVELEALKAAGGTNVDEKIAAVLFRMGHFDEVIERAPSLEKLQPVKVLTVAAVASRDGAARAAEKAEELADEQLPAMKLLASAAFDEMGVRQFRLAADLMDAAFAGKPAPPQLRTFIAGMRRASGTPRVLKAGSPEAVVAKLFDDVLHGDPASIKDALSKRRKQDELKDFDPVKLRRALGRNSFPGVETAAMLDAFLQLVDFESEGDPAVGWRVKFTMLEQRFGGAFFLVPENGKPALYASEDELADLGKVVVELANAGNGAGAGKWLDWVQETREGAFRLRDLWRHGGNDAALAKRAGLVLAAGMDPAAETADYLVAEAAKAEGPTARVLRRTAALALVAAKRYPEALAQAEALEKLSTDDAFFVRTRTLRAEGRHDELLALAQERLAGNPDDDAAGGVTEQELERAHRFDELSKMLGAWLAGPRPAPWMFNNAAWDELFRSSPDYAQAQERAHRAVSMDRRVGWVHTLATVQAESGDGPGARETLLQLLDLRGGEPSGIDWYVVGRIAELYGMNDEALAAYRKVPEDGNDNPVGMTPLVRRRMAVLEGTSGK